MIAKDEGTAAEEIEEALPGVQTATEDFPEDEFETVTLSLRQKLLIGGATLFSFLFFTIYFLPYDLIIRSLINSYAGSVRVEFKTFDPGVIGPDVIEELKIQVPNGSFFGADRVESSLSIRDVLSDRANGTVKLENFDVSMNFFAGNIDQADITLDLRNYQGGLARMQGFIGIKTGFIKLAKLPEVLPIPIAPEDIKIKQLNLQLRTNRGNLNFDGTTLQSNLFNVTLRGGGRTSGGLESLQLDAQLCVKPDPRLEETSPDVFGYFTILGGTGAAGGEKCLQLTGPAGSPAVKPL